MEIITLQEYTDQYVSLYEGQIRNLPNDLALRLINKGVAAQHDKDILNSTTTQDNGKVLTVVNGKPAFVENSDGGGQLVVGGTEDAEAGTITLDKTFSEIETAIKTRGAYIYSEHEVDAGITHMDIGNIYHVIRNENNMDNPEYSCSVYFVNNTNDGLAITGATFTTNTLDGYPVFTTEGNEGNEEEVIDPLSPPDDSGR